MEAWLKTGQPLNLHALNFVMGTPECSFDRKDSITLQLYDTYYLNIDDENPDRSQVILDEDCGISIIDQQADAIGHRRPEDRHRRRAKRGCTEFMPTSRYGSDTYSDMFVKVTHELHMGWLRAAYNLGRHIKRVIVLVDLDERVIDNGLRYVRDPDDFLQWRDLIELIRVLRHGVSPTSSFSCTADLTGVAREVHIIGHPVLEELNDIDLSAAADTVLTEKVMEKLNTSITRFRRDDWWNRP